jgi:ketosteroid isomerase-like protein
MIAKRSEPQSAAEVIEDVYAAFGRGDLAEMQRLAAPDLVVHIPGKSTLAGTHRGVGEVIALTARASTRFIPSSLKVVSIEEEAGERVATALFDVAIRAIDGTTALLRIRQTFRFDEAWKIVEARLQPDDQRKFDKLLG